IIKIGRSPDCEIQLLVEGISRSHLHVIHEDGEYYVIDQGSTNGSFINGERLEAGEKAPFNSFFPVKLGFTVYLSLLDQIDIGERNNIGKQTSRENINVKSSDKTRVLKINNSVHTSPGRTNPHLKLSAVKAANASKKKDNNFKTVLLLCCLGLFLYFSYP